MEVDAHTATDSVSDFESVPSCSVTAMDAEDVVHQHIREASQSPNSIPILTRYVLDCLS